VNLLEPANVLHWQLKERGKRALPAVELLFLESKRKWSLSWNRV